MMCKILLQVIQIIQKLQLLLLTVGQNAFDPARNRAKSTGHVDHVESENTTNVMMAHNRVDLRQSRDWNARDSKTLQVDDEAIVLNLPRHNHVSDHILHAKDQHLDESLNACFLVLVPLIWNAIRSADNCGPQSIVSSAEVDYAVLQVLFDLIVRDWSHLEVVRLPFLGCKHQLNGLVRISTSSAQKSPRHNHNGWEKLQALLRCLFLQSLDTCCLLVCELDVAIDLSLSVAVLEITDNHIRLRLKGKRLNRRREGADVLLLHRKIGWLFDGPEAIHHWTLLEAASCCCALATLRFLRHIYCT
mmetsp:Transcript_77754/g.171731  ORF Transcript_77754/g.171731 Transcript_77754/m.171731 type:complete len:303 (-) Transcript_77754:63-971(-)